jgi:hypothetical protein
MAKVVNRIAIEIQDGDEISLNHGPDEYGEWDGGAMVLEKTIDENDRVVLVVSVNANEVVRTKPRPREEKRLMLFDAYPYGDDQLELFDGTAWQAH